MPHMLSIRPVCLTALTCCLCAGLATAAVPTNWSYRIVARTGTSPVGVPAGSSLLSAGDPAIDDSGNVVARYTTSSGGDGVLLYNTSTQSTSIVTTTLQGDLTGDLDIRGGKIAVRYFLNEIRAFNFSGSLLQSFGTGGPEGVTGAFNRPRLTDAGKLGYRAQAGADVKFILDDAGQPRTQFRYAQTGAPITFLYSPTVNGSGQLAARVDVNGFGEIRRYNAPPATGFSTIISVTGNPTFNAISNLTDLNDQGVVAYYARRTAGNVFELRTSDNRTIVVAGQFPVSTTSFTNFTPSISESGLVAMRGLDLGGVSAIFLGDGSATATRFIGAGSTITTNLGTVTLNGGTNVFGGNIRLNSKNQLVFLARLNTGEDVLLVASPLVPGCSPADIAYGDGEPLPPIGQPGGFNPVGPDGGDFDCFFNFYFAPEPDNSVCDIAYGDGEPLPPFGATGGFNPGVDGGDFDCFFNYYFNGCL